MPGLKEYRREYPRICSPINVVTKNREANMARTNGARNTTFTSDISAWAFSDTDRPVLPGLGYIRRLIHGNGPLKCRQDTCG